MPHLDLLAHVLGLGYEVETEAAGLARGQAYVILARRLQHTPLVVDLLTQIQTQHLRETWTARRNNHYRPK